MAGLIDLFFHGGAVSLDLDLEVFAYVDVAYALIAHVFHGALDGFTLGIEDSLFRSDDDFDFHVRDRPLSRGRGW